MTRASTREKSNSVDVVGTFLGSGDLKTALIFKNLRVSKSAKQKIEAAGGKVEQLQIAELKD